MRNGRTKRANKKKTYNRALHVLARMRRTNQTLSVAAREEHIDPRTVRRYLGPELRRLSQGKIKPTTTDRRRRNMLIPTPDGTSPVAIHGSAQASQLGRYMAAVGKYLRTGETDALKEFSGRSIAGHALITDPEGCESRFARHRFCDLISTFEEVPMKKSKKAAVPLVELVLKRHFRKQPLLELLTASRTFPPTA